MGQFIQTREVVGQDVHRVPPRWRRMRSAGGKIVRELVPASTKLVDVRRMRHVDRSKPYPNGGLKERERAIRRVSWHAEADILESMTAAYPGDPTGQMRRDAEKLRNKTNG